MLIQTENIHTIKSQFLIVPFLGYVPVWVVELAGLSNLMMVLSVPPWTNTLTDEWLKFLVEVTMVVDCSTT